MAAEKKVTVPGLLQMKAEGRKIAMLALYDYPTAQLAEEAGVDVLLVGDSVGMVVLGYENTLPVTLEEILHHVKAVGRAARRALVVADMPFLSYQGSPDDAVMNAGLMLKEGGAHAVKLEGGAYVAPLVARLVASGIPVIGHVGLQPQAIRQVGGYRAQGKSADAARRLIEEAAAIEAAGAFALVLELVPRQLAAEVSARLAIPTIGIGAGEGCDGQVQVAHDVLGLSPRIPRHARPAADLRTAIRAAFETYANEVRSGAFPAPEQGIEMDPEELRKALEQ